jgi:hypothetical protein
MASQVTSELSIIDKDSLTIKQYTRTISKDAVRRVASTAYGAMPVVGVLPSKINSVRDVRSILSVMVGRKLVGNLSRSKSIRHYFDGLGSMFVNLISPKGSVLIRRPYPR